ncbi:MAG: chemotaxis protein CheW [Desulfovibrio sp.]
MTQQKVLLESGTNELEILEFFLGGQSYGINVAKILQIIPYRAEDFTETPESPAEMPGVLLWRGQTLPLIDLNIALNPRTTIEAERPIVLVTEFNNVENCFLTDGVNRIHRLSWEQVDPVTEFLERYTARITGSVHVDDTDILLVDFERLVAELFPDSDLGYHAHKIPVENLEERRGTKRIVFAEDSGFIRATITNILKDAGYVNVAEFENGKDALKHLLGEKQKAEEENKPITDYVDIVISDIEMPQLDGLTLCKKIKTDSLFSKTPVVMFSSMINEQMVLKCQDVGADAHATKPQIKELVQIIDTLLKI